MGGWGKKLIRDLARLDPSDHDWLQVDNVVAVTRGLTHWRYRRVSPVGRCTTQILRSLARAISNSRREWSREFARGRYSRVLSPLSLFPVLVLSRTVSISRSSALARFTKI